MFLGEALKKGRETSRAISHPHFPHLALVHGMDNFMEFELIDAKADEEFTDKAIQVLDESKVRRITWSVAMLSSDEYYLIDHPYAGRRLKATAMAIGIAKTEEPKS